MQRLDRILSEAGVASRKELRAIIRAGQRNRRRRGRDRREPEI
ncbi:MAG: hypothetical protein ACLS3C_04465 [Oscillospiraceae bacterium]